MIDDAFLEARGMTVPNLPLARFGRDLHAAWIDFGRLDLLSAEAARSPDDLWLSVRHVRITDRRSAAGRADHHLTNNQDRDARPVRCSVWFYRPPHGRSFAERALGGHLAVPHLDVHVAGRRA
jgi:hypothetical protein